MFGEYAAVQSHGIWRLGWTANQLEHVSFVLVLMTEWTTEWTMVMNMAMNMAMKMVK